MKQKTDSQIPLPGPLGLESYMDALCREKPSLDLWVAGQLLISDIHKCTAGGQSAANAGPACDRLKK